MKETMSVGVKLTKRVVESFKPHKNKEILAWDSEIKGFGVRVCPTGRRTYFIQYRKVCTSLLTPLNPQQSKRLHIQLVA
jgi:hypothetical protein